MVYINYAILPYNSSILSAKQSLAVKIELGKSLNRFYNEEPIFAWKVCKSAKKDGKRLVWFTIIKKGGEYMENLAKVERTTLTMKETAEYLGISYWLVNQLVRRREIPCARVGGRVLFRVHALDEYLKEKEEKSFKYQERR